MAHSVHRASIDLQSQKIREIAEALRCEGHLCLDNQASVIGLPRSTTWSILHAKHKNSGLSASVIRRMLAQPQLPQLVGRKLLEYIEEKSSGVYGHNPQQVRRFVSGLDGCGGTNGAPQRGQEGAQQPSRVGSDTGWAPMPIA